MKNHIVVKTIAILLCAAALLGAIGCGAGVAVLTGLGMYDKNPTQLYEGWVNDRGLWLAHDVSVRYASQTLGNCPEPLLEQYYYVNQQFRPGYYRYELKDAEGNVLLSDGNPDITGEALTFPAAGKYLHLVSTEAVSSSTPVDSVEPDVPCDGIHLAGNGIQMTEEGQIHHLIVTSVPPSSDESFTTINLVPNNTTEKVIFASGDEAVATVDENGLITAVGNGITSIHISCGDLIVDFPVSCQFAEAVPEPAALLEAAPATEATEPPFQYDAWDAEKWEEIQAWIQEEWSKDSWDPDKQHELTDWIKKNWAEEDWNEDQWAQLHHWIEDEWNPKEPAETVETTVPETTVPETVPATEPVIDLKALEEESRRKEAELETIPEEVTVNGRPISDYEVYFHQYYDHQAGEEVRAQCVMVDMPEYTFELYLAPGAFAESILMPVLELLWVSRQMMLPLLFVFLLLFALLGVYLCCAAGRKPKSDEVRASGLNRMPLEVYAGLTIGAVALAIMFTCYGSLDLIPMNLLVGCASVVAVAYLACLVVVGFLFAFVAQLKTPGRFWLTNSLCGHCWRIVKWLWGQFLRLFPFFFRWAKGLWNFARRIIGSLLRWIGNGAKFIGGKIGRLYAMLPMIWQWLLVGGGLILLLIIAMNMDGAVAVPAIILFIAVVIYGAMAFGTLLDATKRMSEGDLNTPIDDKWLLGCFKDFADNLKALAKVAMVAAQKQLKSERMKTELITNVSHDIKTPLTSIVSYVDLLQKPHTPEEEAQYLEVLNRQSLSLKKLIEDLIEMSKASTGNMTVDIQQVDAVESVNQALGEFADKLDRVSLTPMFRHSEPSVPMMADGKLVWRVLHNLLSNAVKYALPGTRLYIDLMEVEGKVILSMKNVSRDELNVDAAELMERFVRGDDSRNTEGSGLGLNIAKSMMELQKGELQLLVDGDLFKVTLIFPAN